MNNIEPTIRKGKANGYCEYYYPNGNLDNKGYYIDGNPHGWHESYMNNGDLYYKGNYNNGVLTGYVVFGKRYQLSNQKYQQKTYIII